MFSRSPRRRLPKAGAHRGLAAGLLIGIVVTACGGKSAPGVPQEVLNIYTWTDYIAPDTVANFEKATGIKVHYDTYDSNEVLETKLLTGHTNYDIVIPTDTFFERMAPAGVFRELDEAALPNRKNLDPDILRRMATSDPGNRHAVPYMWSTAGLGYNVDQVTARLGSGPWDSWKLLFDPKNAAKLQDCGITVVDSPLDLFASALIYLGKDANSRNPDDLEAAAQLLMEIRPFVRSIDSSQYISDLANGGTCLVFGWSGDILQSRARATEAGNGVKIRYFLPSEGAIVIIDMMSMPADAPHPRNATIWMNYLMQPEVMAGITNAIKYPNGNLASLRFVKDEIKNDPAIYPDAASRDKLQALKPLPPESQRLVTRLWTRFRTNQ